MLNVVTVLLEYFTDCSIRVAQSYSPHTCYTVSNMGG